MDKPHIAICVPVYKWPPHPKFLESVDRCEHDDRFHTKAIYITGDANLDSARARVLAEYLKYEQPYDWFCQMDGDIEFSPDTIWTMINRGVNVIGAAYAFKCEGPKAGQPVIRLLEKAEVDDRNLIQVRYLGGGSTFVKDIFLKRMCEFYKNLQFNLHPEQLGGPLGPESFALWNPLVVEQPLWGENKWELLSEDWAFCHRVGLLGEPVWLDLCAIIGHWDGDKCYQLHSS